ncbi:lipopolysaccharide biosynthesis protein [Mobilicoccus pelagius]|uniref:Putative polysaccharide biosynthesis protein n=1 Tax=Mobilicoccus pelagius NBRC 104925 TaxID=1089455 RepID=H5UMV9_9MICO|nr:oligosaccharide flippase family protein [Mobilicoccus pelagius]GAB47067.1 putative polysaccharide biosynthesis protein [Mobilicoccus pelagius NBRC 104925]
MRIIRRLRDGSLLGASGRDIAYLSSGALVSQIVLAAGQIVTARLYGPDDFGHFAVILAWANILAVLATLRYEMAIPLAESEDDARALTRLCLTTTTLASLTVFVVLGGLALVRGVPGLWVGGAWWAIPFVLWGTACFSAIRMAASRDGRFARQGRAGVVSSVGQVLTQVVLGIAGWAPGLSVGQGIGRVLNAAWMGTGGLLRRGTSFRVVASRWRRMPMLNTFPALLNVVSVGAVAPLVARWYGVAFAGQFGFATRLLAAPAVLLGQAVSQVLFPRLARLDRESDGARTGVELRRATEALVLVALPVFSIVWLLGPELFALVFGVRWREAGVLAAVMAPWLAANFVSSPLSTYATVRDQLGRILLISLAEAGSRLVGLYVGVLTASAVTGVAWYSVAGVVICAAFTSWVLGLAGVSRQRLLRDLLGPFVVTLLAAAASVVARLLGAGPVVVAVGVLGVFAVSVLCGRRVLRLLPGRAR